jgi:hypothetical protein
MTSEEAWLRVAQECPRRILASLHSSGVYHHGTTTRFPGKILCCHHDAPLPEDWTATPAQQKAEQVLRHAHRQEVSVP